MKRHVQIMQRIQSAKSRQNAKNSETARFRKLMNVAHRFLLISGPRVRVPGGAPNIERKIVRFDALFRYVTPKIRGLHGQCTVFARSTFSWESSAWAGIALKCVVNFASGQQCQTELCLYFRAGVLQKFQQSSYRDGRFAFGGYSLRAGAFRLA